MDRLTSDWEAKQRLAPTMGTDESRRSCTIGQRVKASCGLLVRGACRRPRLAWEMIASVAIGRAWKGLDSVDLASDRGLSLLPGLSNVRERSRSVFSGFGRREVIRKRKKNYILCQEIEGRVAAGTADGCSSVGPRPCPDSFRSVMPMPE